MSVNIKVTGGLNIEWGQIDPKVTGGLNGVKFHIIKNHPRKNVQDAGCSVVAFISFNPQSGNLSLFFVLLYEWVSPTCRVLLVCVSMGLCYAEEEVLDKRQ